MTEKRNLMFVFGIILIAVFVVGCQTIPPPGPGPGPGTPPSTGEIYEFSEVFEPDTDLKANNFKSEAEFNEFVKSNSGTNQYGYALGGLMRGVMVESMAMEDSALPLPRGTLNRS